MANPGAGGPSPDAEWRFALYTGGDRVANRFGVPSIGEPLAPRFNIGPGQVIWASAASRTGTGSEREPTRRMQRMRWGLRIEGSAGRSRMLAAVDAGEALARTPDAPGALPPDPMTRTHRRDRHPAVSSARRCLIPADGFYVWRPPVCGGSGHRQAYYATRQDEEPFAMAALFVEPRERVGERASEALPACVVVTLEADDRCVRFGDRMPLVLDKAAEAAWLDPTLDLSSVSRNVASLLAPATSFIAYPVSPRVNSPTAEGPELIAELR